MVNLLNQPALKLIECIAPNLTQVELPALVRFECTVKLPKTNKFYKKLHEVTAGKYAYKFIEVAGGENFSRANVRFLHQSEINEIENEITEAVSNPVSLRKFNLQYFPSNTISPRIEVERIEPLIEPDKSSPMLINSLFKLISKPYFIKEHLGKHEYSEHFLFTEEKRLEAFQQGKNVKFEKLSVVPVWVRINEAQVI